MVTTVWDPILGQERAVSLLRGALDNPVHAYLLVGPEGCGKEEAANVFAGVLLSGSGDPTDRSNMLARAGTHPDIHVVAREGASISKDQSEDVIGLASTTPKEGARKALILHEVHLMQPAAIVRLLKTLEEPPPGVFFILLADRIDESMSTIVSRCLTVQFAPLTDEVIERVLVGGGADPDLAAAAARLSRGNLSRARLLVSDRQMTKRHEFFVNIPRRIDGTGATVVAIVEEIMAMLDDCVEPIHSRHEQEIADLERNLALMGVKRGGKKSLEERHKREVRRHRTDELRAGLTAVASVYRDELTRNGQILRPEAYTAAVARIHEAMRHLSLNVNEAIMLRDLIWSLPSPLADAALQHVLAEATQ